MYFVFYYKKTGSTEHGLGGIKKRPAGLLSADARRVSSQSGLTDLTRRRTTLTGSPLVGDPIEKKNIFHNQVSQSVYLLIRSKLIFFHNSSCFRLFFELTISFSAI